MPPGKRSKKAHEVDNNLLSEVIEDVDGAPPAQKRSARRGKLNASPGGRPQLVHLLPDRSSSPVDLADWEENEPLHQAKGSNPSGVGEMAEAVVKVFCVHCQSNFSLPWQRRRQYSSTSSGFIVAGNRILTNAHCVEYAASVKVKRRGSDEKYIAHVVSTGAECDIAMLSVEDPSFFEGVTPVQFGGLPSLQEGVTVVGYPIGGDTMSVTSGVVSRIEVTSYVHGSTELLGVQIDAAINSGNSGGPAFNERGQCVGIAFQSLKGADDAENIGYIIPPPVVQHFVADVERNGHYTGFPQLGIEWQKMENPDLRSASGMKAGQRGVMVKRVDPCGPTSKVLRPHDVITSFDGTSISNDGTVAFRSGERISFSYLVSQKCVGDKAVLKVIRAKANAAVGFGQDKGSGGDTEASNGPGSSGKGREGRGKKGGSKRQLDGGQGPATEGEEVTISLLAPVRLIPFHIDDNPPSYFVHGGLVFTPVTVPYLKSEYGKDYEFDAPVPLLNQLFNGLAEEPDHQVVVLSQVLAADVNIGYEDLHNLKVESLNGEGVTNMRRLVQLVDGCKSDWLSIVMENFQTVVLSAAKARAATPDILSMHCIPSDRSPDLKNL